MALHQIVLDVRMLDGNEYSDLKVVSADRMKLAAHARASKWGSLEDDPDRSAHYLAWCALCRLGHFTGSFAAFIELAENVMGQEAAHVVDPTQTAT